VQVVLTVIQRRELDKVRAIIEAFDRRAFYSVDQLQAVTQGVAPTRRGLLPSMLLRAA
jgi:hypothetical protein